jgi:DNA gyrase subunit B
MKDLVDRGYIYIAQPPLFRAKRGRQESFIKDERLLEQFLIHRATESRSIVLSTGVEIKGQALEHRLEKLIAYRKVLQVVERRGPSRRAITALLEGGARDKTFWTDRALVDGLAAHLQQPQVTAAVVDDPEHQAFAVVLTDRSFGYDRHHRLDLEFVTTAEFRMLAAAYVDVRDILMGPVTIRTATSTQTAEVEEDDEPEVTDEATDASAAPAAAPAAKASKDKDADQSISSIDELVDYFVTAGRRGLAINRYKGLGEMNPDTLWETTMDPTKRTLLQVRADDHLEADLMFTTLMGDQVEPRRKFIEDNALDVKNLDI